MTTTQIENLGRLLAYDDGRVAVLHSNLARLLEERKRLLEALDRAEDRMRGLASSAAQNHQTMDEIAVRLIEEADATEAALDFAEEAAR